MFNGLGSRRDREKKSLKWYGYLIRMNNERKTKHEVGGN